MLQAKKKIKIIFKIAQVTEDNNKDMKHFSTHT